VLVNLGREDKLDVEALRRLVASVNRYLGEEDDVAMPLAAQGGPLSVESSRPVGRCGCWVSCGSCWTSTTPSPGVSAAGGRAAGLGRSALAEEEQPPGVRPHDRVRD
jgi:hypothetical protein